MVPVHHVQNHVVEDSIGVVVILVRTVDPVPAAKFRLVDVQENQIEHVLYLVILVPEENIDLHVIHAVHVHRVVLAKRLQLRVHRHQILFVKQKHIRVPVPMVQERQDLLLGVLAVHHAMVIIN